MRTLIVVVALTLVACSAANILSKLAPVHKSEPEWPQFVTFSLQFGRNYPTTGEAELRYTNFKHTLARNVELRASNPLATFGVNKFADLSVDEFRSKYLMPANSTGRVKDIPKFFKHKHQIPAVKRTQTGAPMDNDWCAQGACTAVKDQGQCGSCWAFSATEALESAIALSGQAIPTLSPEQIVDCDTSDGGCNGGDPRSAMNYVVGAGGQDTEASYPYTAGGGQSGSCNFQSGSVAGTLSGPQDVSDGDESALQSFLQNNGPPSVCVDASSWSSYTGGVMTTCGDSIDHAVQATGISSQFGTPAYIVRNSWNTDWGVNGFIYLAIGANTCGIATEVTWVTGAAPSN